MIVELEITTEQANAALRRKEGGLHHGIRAILQEEVRRLKSYECSDHTEDFIKRRLEVTEDRKDVLPLKTLYHEYILFSIREGLDKRRDSKGTVRRRVEQLDVVFGIFTGNIRGFRFLKLKTNEDEDWL
jgi:hypothetical protein